MLGALLLYAGGLAVLVGVIGLLRGWWRKRPPTRRRGGLFVLLGLLSVLAAYLLPAPEQRIDRPTTRLDEFVPAWQFDEHHDTRVAAPPARVFDAIKSVRADDIAFFQTLTWIRRFGRSGPEGILNAPGQQPILDVATKTGFILLADQPPNEIVVGAVLLVAQQPRGSFAALRRPETFKETTRPGLCLVGMNFLVRPDGAGSVLSTDTRIFATDAAAHRAFATYWRTIYPGSAIIRRMWLRAIKLRAEQA
jgi:hypothetical protein